LGTVSVTRVRGDVTESLRRSISLVGSLNLSKVPVLIKPNICTETDDSGGANTSINVTRAVIEEVLRYERRAEVRIIESDSFAKRIERAFEKLGYRQLEDEYQARNCEVSLVNLSKEPAVTLPLNGLYFKEIELPRILLEPRYLISAAKAKTHQITRITGVLKNQFGCLPERNKAVYHRHIDEVVVDVNKAIRPDLCIVDGIVGMEGVYRGRLRKIGVLLCGYEPASVDATLSRLMGFDPSKITHIGLAEKHGLGNTNPQVVGEKVESVRVKFQEPSRLVATLGRNVPGALFPTFSSMYRRFLRRG